MKYKNKVAEIRKQKKLTQVQLSQKSGTSVTQIQNIEYGENAPNVYLAMAITKALESTVEELFAVTPYTLNPTNQ